MIPEICVSCHGWKQRIRSFRNKSTHFRSSQNQRTCCKEDQSFYHLCDILTLCTSNLCPTSHYNTIHWSLDPISKYLQTSCQNNSGVRKTYGEISVLLIVHKLNVCFNLDPRLALSRRPCFFFSIYNTRKSSGIHSYRPGCSNIPSV